MEEVLRNCKESQNPSEILSESLEAIERDVLFRQFLKLECNNCPKKYEYETFNELQLHYKESHGVDGYILCCSNKMKTMDCVYLHIMDHVKSGIYNCYHCNENILNMDCWQKHLQCEISRRIKESTIKGSNSDTDETSSEESNLEEQERCSDEVNGSKDIKIQSNREKNKIMVKKLRWNQELRKQKKLVRKKRRIFQKSRRTKNAANVGALLEEYKTEQRKYKHLIKYFKEGGKLGRVKIKEEFSYY